MPKSRLPLEARCLPVGFAIDGALRARLDRRAKELGRSASYVVRAALLKYLSRPPDPADRRTYSLDPERKGGGR